MKKFNILVALMALSCFQLIGQIEFEKETDKLKDLEVMSGAPMAIADMDGDGLDDIISIHRSRELFISYQNTDRSFDIVDYSTMGTSNWGMTVGDISNNGSNELFIGGAYSDIRLIELDKQGDSQVSVMDGPGIFVQGVSFFDIDNDGNLDAIACHDDGPNGVYMNDGNGNLSYALDGLPFKKFDDDETNSGNYGNVWSDVNGDGLMDYYIAKCRQGVTDINDRRRINQLWINNGDETFTESAEKYGLAIGFQSWTTEFQDIDNDGDMDCLITNHDGPTQLFENINNTSFADISATSGIATEGLPIQGTMKDFDNDGYVDVFITGNDGVLFRNNGDKTFTEIADLESNLSGKENSFACGDLNHDGFLDLMIGYGTGFNGPSASIEDVLWLNRGNNNHWLAVQLEGIESNMSGIGSRIELYGDWGMMVREVRAGESYGVSHTLTQHFGMGISSTIDSIVVRWPSGVIDSYQDVLADQFVSLKENTCIAPPSVIEINGPTTFCNGDDVTLTASPGFTYLWSNGSTARSITVATSGLYSVDISDGSACRATSTAIEVVVDPAETFRIFGDKNLLLCEGESVTIASELGNIISWFDGTVSNSIVISDATTVVGFMEGTCGNIMSNELTVEVIPTPAEPTNINFDFAFDQLTITAEGQGIQWYSDNQGLDLLGSGNELILEGVNSALTVFTASSSEGEGGILSVGEVVHQGSNDFNSDGFNGAMIFEVLEETLLRTVTVDTDTPGLRTIVLRDVNGTSLEEKTFDIAEGKSDLRLNFTIPPGIGYSLTTDAQQNFKTLGYESPRLKRSSVDFGAILFFPYAVDDLIKISGSNFGNNFFYYFYDWKVSKTGKFCTSDLVPVNIAPNSVNSIEENNDISLYPNPSESLFNLVYTGTESFDIRVLSLEGKEQFFANNLQYDYQLDLANFSSGIYLMEIKIGAESYFAKLIKL